MRIFIILIIIAGFISGCKKADSIKEECLRQKLVASDMVAYNGQPIECAFFLELYHFENRQYFLRNNHCVVVDMFFPILDCDGISICNDGNKIQCNNFYDNTVRIGTIGIV